MPTQVLPQVEGPAVIDAEKPTATHAIPLRHGMTAGELAQLFNAKFLPRPADLTVIPLDGWRRTAAP